MSTPWSPAWQTPRTSDSGLCLTALVEHLHAFIREVRLTGREWQLGIDFLTRVGHITDDKRQEFILLSDVLGASMQMITVNDDPTGRTTEATVVGPFFVEDSPLVELGGDISGDASGEPCWVEGRVVDVDGRPLPGARIEVWEADDRRLLRRPVRRRPYRRARPPLRGRRRPLPFLGTDPDAVSHSSGRPGRRPASCGAPLTHAGPAPALHGQPPWHANPRDARIRRR